MVAIIKRYQRHPNSVDNFEIVGLSALIKLFKIYGLRLDVAPGSDKPRRNALLLILYGLFYGVTFILSVRFIVTLVSDDVLRSNFTIVGYAVSMGGYELKTLFCFLHPCFYFSRYIQFLGDLAFTLRRIHDLDPGQKARTKQLTRTMIGMTILDVILFTLMNLIVSDGSLSDLTPIVENRQLNSILEKCIAILGSFVYATLCSFTLFYPFFCLLICKLLIVCFDFYVPYDDSHETLTEPSFKPHPMSQDVWGRNISLADRQKEHRNMCILVRQANDIFCGYLLISIVEEMALAIVLCLENTDVQYFGSVIMVMVARYAFTFWKIGHFILKGICFSAVNEKVKTSLMIPSHSESEAMYNSKEHVQYLLYLKQQTMRPTSITYGGLFPVHLNFIFTIISTAITYMLVINDLPK